MQQLSAHPSGCSSLVVTSSRGVEVRLPSPPTARRGYLGVRFTANGNVARSTTLVRRIR
jgi:hypothetical protein